MIKNRITSTILEVEEDGSLFIEVEGVLKKFNSFKEFGEKIDIGEISLR